MRLENKSTRDQVLVLYRYPGCDIASCVLKPGGAWTGMPDVELLGTFKLVQFTKLVDDPTVCEVEE